MRDANYFKLYTTTQRTSRPHERHLDIPKMLFNNSIIILHCVLIVEECVFEYEWMFVSLSHKNYRLDFIENVQ